MRKDSLTNTIMEDNSSAYISGAITLGYINDMSLSGANTFSSTITSTGIDASASTGIIESSTMIDSSGNLYLKRDLEIDSEVIDFIEKKPESKEIIERIIKNVYLLVSSENKLTRVVFKKNKVEEKIEGGIYLSDKTAGSLIDLNDKINRIIFEEIKNLSDAGKRFELINLFDIKLFDIKNGIKL